MLCRPGPIQVGSLQAIDIPVNHRPILCDLDVSRASLVNWDGTPGRPTVQPDDQGISVGEAARSLGISVPAVRKRIRRGTLRAYKVDGIWRIIVPVLPDPGGDMASPEA